MGARSRKRKRSGTRATDAAAERPAPDAAAPTAAPQPGEDKLARGYARSRARDDEIRANLVPLAPGERPGIVTFAAIVAFVFAIANVATALTGNDISSATGNPSVATAVTTALLLVAGFGMLARLRGRAGTRALALAATGAHRAPRARPPRAAARRRIAGHRPR